MISFISDYYSKDDSGTVQHLAKAKKELSGRNVKEQQQHLAKTLLSHRKMGEAEAVYRLIPDFQLSKSNVNCVFVHTGWPANRFVHIKPVSVDPDDPNYIDDRSTYEIQGKGMYREVQTMISKYQRRGSANNLDKLCSL